MKQKHKSVQHADGASLLDDAFKACRIHFGYAAGFSALLNVLYLTPTIYMLQVYDRVVPTRGVMTLVFLTLVLTFAIGTLSYLDYIRSRLLVRASARLDHQLSGPILRILLSAPRPNGRSAQSAMREFDALRQTMTGAGILALFDAPWTPVYVLICFGINPLLGALALVGVLLLVGITALNEHATKGRMEAANEAGNHAYMAQEFSRNAAGVITALGMGKALTKRHLGGRMRSIRLQAEASFYAGRYMTLSRFLRLLLQSLAMGLGAFLAIEGKLSPGAIFAATLLVSRAIAPTEQIIGAWKGLAQARSGYASLKALFATNPPEAERTLLPAPAGLLQVKNLSVASPTGGRPILNDLAFQIQPGEIIGVIGPSGAGKSTMVRAIVGALTPERGVIRMDGANVEDWNRDYLARHIGYLPQESGLLEGTIKENIARFRTELEDIEFLDRKVVAAAQLCGAHEMILSLPHAYETRLGFGGTGLSAGQAQRVALARALFDEPALIILDEPNAHLDAEGEVALVQTLVRTKARGATAIVVAHRTGVLAAVDRVMILRAGQIEAFGPRDEVVQRIPESSMDAAARRVVSAQSRQA